MFKTRNLLRLFDIYFDIYRGKNRFYSSIAVSLVKRKDKEIDEDPAFREALRKAMAEESAPLTRENLLDLILGE